MYTYIYIYIRHYYYYYYKYYHYYYYYYYDIHAHTAAQIKFYGLHTVPSCYLNMFYILARAWAWV